MNSNKGKNKIVLFHPHYQKGEYNNNQRQPLDILSISALPLLNNYEVVIVDASVQPDYRSRVLEACEDALLFGTTSILGYQVYHSYLMAREVKARYPSLPVVAGGWFPSTMPEMLINQGGADIVVIRQGELTFMELVEALNSGSSYEGIEGIAYKNGGEVVRNPLRPIEDLNKLPSMPYHLIDFEDYFASDSYDRAKTYIYIATGNDLSSVKIRSLDYFSSYGCPDGCKFCTSPLMTGRKWTALEAGRVVEEIGELVRKHNINFMTFCDANWGVSQKRVFEFSEGLLKNDIKIYWGASAEAAILNKYDEEVIATMARSGCVGLLIGAEAAYPATIKSIQKNIKPGDSIKCSERCVKHRIIPEISYIVGYPGESEESIQATIEEGCEIVYRQPEVELGFRLFFPIPTTPLFDRAVELGYSPVASIEDWGSFQNFQTEAYSSLSEKQIKTIRRCQRHYFWWGSERLKLKTRLSLVEKFLNRTSRLRLKYKWLGFPIEYKIYHIIRRWFPTFGDV